MQKFKIPPSTNRLQRMARCKKLSLPTVFERRNHPLYAKDWQACVGLPTEPLFHKDGYYLDRFSGTTWVEFDDRAFLYRDRATFEYELTISQGNNRIEDRVYKALMTLISDGVIRSRGPHAALWQIVHTEHQIRTLRHIWLESRLATARFLKSLRGDLNTDGPSS